MARQTKTPSRLGGQRQETHLEMTVQQNENERKADEYEQKARRVTDPWVKARYLALAKHCRELVDAELPDKRRRRAGGVRIAL